MKDEKLSKFDSDGRRIATVLSDIHYHNDAERQKYLDDGYVVTSDEDYAYYIGNKGTGVNGTGYVRGADGKPTDAPAVIITTEQKQLPLRQSMSRRLPSSRMRWQRPRCRAMSR